MKNNKWGAWLLFFVGVNLLAVSMLLFTAHFMTRGYDAREIMVTLNDSQLEDKPIFKDYMSDTFRQATAALLGGNQHVYGSMLTTGADGTQVYVSDSQGNTYAMAYRDFASSDYNAEAVMEEGALLSQAQKVSLYLGELQNTLEQEGANLLYYISDDSSGKAISNWGSWDKWWPTVELGETSANLFLPDGYGYGMIFDGQRLRIYQDSQLVDYLRIGSGYHLDDFRANSPYLTQNPALAECRILLAVAADITANPYGYSALYELQTLARQQQILGWGCLIAFALGLACLIMAFCGRKSKRAADQRLAALSSRLWLEAKVIFSCFALVLLVLIGAVASGGWLDGLLAILGVLVGFWWLYVMLADLRYNGRRFFSKNVVTVLLGYFQRQEMLKPFQELMLNRFYSLMVVEALLVILSAITFFTVIFPLAFMVLGVYLLFRYIRRFQEVVWDMGQICDQIERIKDGTMDEPLLLAEGSELYEAAGNLNSIQEGFNKALADQIKSERMKVDLVTNISHDLKTPLTSIVSYVDLLNKEELPEAARDYVQILGQKTDRLKGLITDLFDLSKATSANMEVNIQRLDLVKLVRQVEAELEEDIDASGLKFKITLPPEAVCIYSDGNKLHRVLDNLLLNAIKYSLLGSRVFVDLTVVQEQAILAIKNTANYEMDFDSETIQGRFVRGDKARTTEGSGLGLAIARSYTEACGGLFNLAIDGDQFKVTLIFRLAEEQPAEMPEPIELDGYKAEEQETA